MTTRRNYTGDGMRRVVILGAALAALALSSSTTFAQGTDPPPSCQSPNAEGECARVTRWQVAIALPAEVRESCTVRPVYRTTTYPDGRVVQTEDTTTSCAR